MSLKGSLLTCAALAVAMTVRSQASPAPPPAAAAPFDAARPAEPRPVRPAVAPRGPSAPEAAATPFTLEMPKPAPPAAGTGGAADADAIDLSALRYFAAQNDLGRVSAEIRLLRAKHPDWEPPQDLFSEGGSGVDEKPLRDLLARRDFAGVHAGMDVIRRDKPDWQPTADFGGKLALAEAHDAAVKASDAHRWDGVLAAASATPSLLTCSDVDALWRTAEALLRTGDEPRAVAAYRYILSNCTPSDVRLATVQKASVLLASPADLDGLIRMGRTSADGRGEFDQVRLDATRRKIGDATADPAAIQPRPEEIAAVAAGAAGPDGRADAQLLGWYDRSRKDYAGAERWFRAALAAGPDAKAAEGLVLTARDAGDAPEARKLAFQYVGLDPLNRKLMVEVAAAALSDPKAPLPSPDEVRAVMEATDALKSSESAQALGWHLYRGNDVAGAEAWFQKSAQWAPNESAAVGLVVSARRLRHDRDYAARIGCRVAGEAYAPALFIDKAAPAAPPPVRRPCPACRERRGRGRRCPGGIRRANLDPGVPPGSMSPGHLTRAGSSRAARRPGAACPKGGSPTAGSTRSGREPDRWPDDVLAHGVPPPRAMRLRPRRRPWARHQRAAASLSWVRFFRYRPFRIAEDACNGMMCLYSPGGS